MLLLDERILGDGRRAEMWATATGDRVRISEPESGTAGALSAVAIDRVMLRYGRPLDRSLVLEAEADRGDDALDLGGGYRLRRMRFRAAVDAIGRDYLIWERPDGEPLASLATTVAAVLRYLVARLAPDPQKTEA